MKTHAQQHHETDYFASSRAQASSLAQSGQQRGAALVVALILLVIITILGLSSVRSTSQQEHMSANFLDRSLAFESAETGLRVLETPAPTLPLIVTSAYPANLTAAQYADAVCNVAPNDAACNAAGFCPKPDSRCPERYLNPAFAGWVVVPGLPALGALANPPQFISENMGIAPSPPRWLNCEDVIPMDATCIIPVQHYRVTTRSTGADRATVLLQTDYAIAL
ncbi:MAG: PilX N-terminal domain-containing pilus assembly protein [Halothiobacillaceae bacterium]|nr:PilX N-terminal domain-containing pilus assembly protein [Halothiobacillaceae bacterium]